MTASRLTLEALRRFDEADDCGDDDENDTNYTSDMGSRVNCGGDDAGASDGSDSAAAFDSEEERMDRILTPRELAEIEAHYQQSHRPSASEQQVQPQLQLVAPHLSAPNSLFRRVSKRLSQRSDETTSKRYEGQDIQSASSPLAAIQWYFAYGSNMNVAQLLTRVGAFREKKLMYLPDYKLAFNKRVCMKPIRSRVPSRSIDPSKCGFANVVPCPGERVYGIAYALHQTQLDSMDVYEGVSSGHYQRFTMVCYDADNAPVKCEVYVAAAGATDEGLLPTDAYLSHLLGGRGLLPEYYRDMLLKQPTIRK